MSQSTGTHSQQQSAVRSGKIVAEKRNSSRSPSSTPTRSQPEETREGPKEKEWLAELEASRRDSEDTLPVYQKANEGPSAPGYSEGDSERKRSSAGQLFDKLRGKPKSPEEVAKREQEKKERKAEYERLGLDDKNKKQAFSPHADPALHRPFKLVASNGHLQAVEGVLHDKIRVELVAFFENGVGVLLHRLGEEEKLCARGGLGAAEQEARRLQRLDAGGVARGGDGREVLRDCVHTVESACEDQVVVAGELAETVVKGAVVDEAAGFVDDEEGVDNPRQLLVWLVWFIALAVAYRDENVRKVRALIIGPPETPYEFGFFEFKVVFGADYPSVAPTVTCTTTNAGRTRFNPNVYADGKVCLSILGTWRGESGEQWSTAQGLESILISIQSLLSSNPYENEPGFENIGQGSLDAEAVAYAAKIRHESLRISVLNRLEKALGIDSRAGRRSGTAAEATQPSPPAPSPDDAEDGTMDLSEPFDDLCKRRFLWYYESYLHSIQSECVKHAEMVKDEKPFKMTPFEHPGNTMLGKFNYSQLEKRFKAVRQAIDHETESWIVQTRDAAQREKPLTLFFQQKFAHIVEDFKHRHAPVDFELVDDNPCVWRIVLFGRPMTNLDGGVFKIRMTFSLNFPELEQPRVVVETPIFHQRVAKDGVLCYFPKKTDDLASHIEAIIDAIEEESPAYDPRTLVNLEAARLLWGSTDEKKLYNRKLRRSAQESVEYVSASRMSFDRPRAKRRGKELHLRLLMHPSFYQESTAAMSNQQALGSVLVTGGCGFLGSHIVRLLIGRYPAPATKVHVLDLHTNRNTFPEASYHAGDLTDPSSVRKILAQVKPNVVIHTASPVFSSVTGKSKELMYKVNVEGTRVLLEASKEAAVKAFVYTSSASVISDTVNNLINADERWSLVRGKLQVEYYSDTKAEAEQLVLSHNAPASTHRFLTTAIRPSAMFGESDVQVIPNMLQVLRDGRTGWQLGTNDNLFDFTYVGNVAHAHLLAARRLLEAYSEATNTQNESTKVDGEAFIITNTTPIYFWDFARALWWRYHSLDTSATKPPATLAQTKGMGDGFAIMLASIASFVFWLLRLGEPKLTPARVRYSCMTRYFRTAKAEERLGYEPLWELDEGIERTAKWFYARDQESAAKKDK
ncbi:hypothetical protein FH972_024266 [Carpinus fangiana]|uniref:Ubiquitin-conjugating enzyme E2 Z n=1 Tax=Carpinus fangiana TaxID=176857 RepID=A0A5N6KXK0_9ROSI|nr:hypothetical protein FH972_024266 [Carpinus fangiana]